MYLCICTVARACNEKSTRGRTNNDLSRENSRLPADVPGVEANAANNDAATATGRTNNDLNHENSRLPADVPGVEAHQGRQTVRLQLWFPATLTVRSRNQYYGQKLTAEVCTAVLRTYFTWRQRFLEFGWLWRQRTKYKRPISKYMI